MNKSNLLLSLLALFLLSSCSKKYEYHQFCSIPKEGWSKTDTLSFTISDLQEYKSVDLSINIRNDYSYPYKDIYIACLENITDSSIIHIDTLHLQLADKDGFWIGKGMGHLFQSTHFYKIIKKPQLTDSTTLRIIPLMKDTLLMGLQDIGIHITHSSDVPDQHLSAKKQIIR
ncbi:gliding motility lipoprotein GldH [Bacteroides coprosuis]|uniref:gliding motility lipoprotein GldH n=1 Tax=Bacteroides coprosuis TaxID=151276 RepID=UPI001E00355C|nr:gliding motility lipoprotein GldH [Bacteroides coprosuis]HJD92358.1 gliding motility lipoprotein GldH [Bacteroides coprosuis]